jgi:hypothetical protein
VGEGESVAIVTGYQSRARAGLGSALVICERGEWDGEKYTGSAICVKVTYILQDAEKYGLKDGYVIIGIRHLEPRDMREES